MNRRRLSFLLVVLMLTLAARATAAQPSRPSQVGSARAAQSATYEKGEVRVFVCCAGGEADLKARAKINKDFEASHPGVKIKQETLPAGTNYFEKLQTLIAAGNTPDVFDMWEGYVQPYAEAGHLLDMDPFLQSGELSKDQFEPNILALNSWNDKLYSLPIEYVPYPAALFYNTKLFEDAGLQPPDASWSWTQVADAARKLTKVEGGKTQQWGLLFDFGFYPTWLSWMWANGGDFFNADQTKCALTDPANTEALQFWADLVSKDKVAPQASVVQGFEGIANGFKTGKVAMYLGAGWDAPEFDKTANLSYGMAPGPTSLKGGRGTYLMNLTWAISSRTKMKQTAWEYVKYFATVGEKDRLSTISSVPAYKPLFSEWLTPEKEQKGYGLYAEGVKYAHVPGAGAKWEKISTLAQAQLDLLFAGKASAQEVAEKICPQVDAELART